MLICVIRTKFTFSNAKIIRYPIDIRGKSYIHVEKGFTTGRSCRLEALAVKSNSQKKLMTIGRNVEINDYVHITATVGVNIGDNVLIASKVYISDVVHGNYSNNEVEVSSPFTPPRERTLHSSPVTIEDNVWLGENVCVLPGVTIGKGSIIGASSVVNKNIPSNSIAVGVPAIVIKKFNEVTKEWARVDSN